MSVIGLTFSLTQWLTLLRSRQAACDITMSRGCDAPLPHSVGLSLQKSIQPIGARVGCPRLASRGCWSPAFADVLTPKRMVMTAKPIPCPLMLNTVAPVCCWDHKSHEDFAPPLNRPGCFEANTSKSCGEFEPVLSSIRFKFE